MTDRKIRISKRTVDQLSGTIDHRLTYWDADVKGFGVRLNPGGRRVYVVKYRVAGRQRWFTIGEHGSPWTPDQARDRALQILRAAADGKDPQSEKQERRGDLTVAALIDQYLADGPATKPAKRAASWRTDASNLNRHLRPVLGRMTARLVADADMGRLVHAVMTGRTAADERTGFRGRARVTGGPAAAERVLAISRAMFAWGAERGLVDRVPGGTVRLAQRAGRERFLSIAEAGRLLGVIANMEQDRSLCHSHADAVRLLLLTGARKSEILGLRWEEVDLESRRLTLPPERTKAGGKTGTRRIALSETACSILRQRERVAEHVFPPERSQSASGHTTGLQKAWERIRGQAELPDVRLHDLRHTYASLALAQGAALAFIGKSLGHSSARVTERYAHLGEDPARAVADTVSALLEVRP